MIVNWKFWKKDGEYKKEEKHVPRAIIPQFIRPRGRKSRAVMIYSTIAVASGALLFAMGIGTVVGTALMAIGGSTMAIKGFYDHKIVQHFKNHDKGANDIRVSEIEKIAKEKGDTISKDRAVAIINESYVENITHEKDHDKGVEDIRNSELEKLAKEKGDTISRGKFVEMVDKSFLESILSEENKKDMEKETGKSWDDILKNPSKVHIHSRSIS